MRSLLLFLSASILVGCSATPKGVAPVENFELDRYLGTWYEIARLDHRFERGLSKVSATYVKRDDGGIDVINRGYNAEKDVWKEATGRAYFIDRPSVAQLKVSFFWPFYGGYNVLALDRQAYSYALVCGPNRNYLWLLSRQKQLEQQIVKDLIDTAAEFGFATDRLIFVDQRE